MCSGLLFLRFFLRVYSDVKKQLDFRWKQIDRFETSVKNLAEVKNSWRRKYNIKEGELEASKVSILSSFLSSCVLTPAVHYRLQMRNLHPRFLHSNAVQQLNLHMISEH